jgi:hypothetical protein
MTNDRFRPRLEAEDDLTRGLRSIYAQPAERGYWDALEAKIIARVAAGGTGEIGRQSAEWWVFFGDWVRAGIVAAGIAAAAAGVALWQAQTAEASAAFEAAWEVAPEVPVQTAAQTPAARDATFRYVISY